MTEQEQVVPEKDRSKLGWFFYNTRQSIGSFFGKHPYIWSIVGILAVGYMIHMRWFFQPYVLEGRKFFVASLIAIFFMWMTGRALRNRGGFARKTAITVVGALAAVGLYFGYPVNQYVTSYLAYQSLDISNLNTLPLTANERVLPLNAVDSLARERVDRSEVRVTSPDLIHTPQGDMWTLALEPNRMVGRVSGVVDEIIQVSATDIAPDFARGEPINVSFPTGEDMMFSDNIHTCVLRAFGPWRYLNYEVGNVLYMPDNDGEWVQVVSLIKWTGFIFPRPEFGGVQIIRQDVTNSSANRAERMFTGCGDFIPADKVRNVPFLRGQNLVAPKVTRFIAESYQFREGFWAPMSWNNEGTIIIPDLPSDVNPQPFTLHFVMPGETEGSLYAYFALEPSEPENTALAISLLIPADNPDRVYQIVHSELGGSLIGVSSVSAKVRESQKLIDWSQNSAVEHRAYIRMCQTSEGLAPKFHWMTSVVAVTQRSSDGNASDFTVGSVPDVVFTDARTGSVTWPEANDAAGWNAELRCVGDE